MLMWDSEEKQQEMVIVEQVILGCMSTGFVRGMALQISSLTQHFGGCR